jgi:OPA family sugar phosphate sensor protein UhpC-like MFS transporter
MANICILISIVLYLAFMVAVGAWYTKRNKNADDFYLGGRKLGPYATAMSAEASDMSSWLLMGLPGLAFFNGLADPFWTAVGLAVGTWFNWLLVAKPLRYYSAEISAITVPEFFSLRFGDKKRLLQGLAAVVIIVFFMHDTPESKGLEPVEILAKEMTPEEYAQAQAKKKAEAADKGDKDEVTSLQKKVLLNPGVWIIALSSAFMYISRYAINGWGTLFLQKVKGSELSEATFLISINALCGIFGTILSGWFSDKVFKGDRRYPALLFGALNSVALAIFLYGGNSWWLNAFAMVLFGTAIGVLICFLGGLMAVDLVPRKASGAALGVVGMASYAAAGIQDIVSGLLIDKNITTEIVDGVSQQVYDFGPAIVFWIAASVISFVLPLFNWSKTKVKR